MKVKDMGHTIFRPVPGYDDLYAGMDASIVLAGKGILEQKIYRNTRYYSVRISREIGIRVVHRLVAAAYLGPKEPGMHVRHGINGQFDDTPGNLCYGTASDNQQDSVRDGTQWNSRKTHCPQKHEYTEDNTYYWSNGSRQCQQCRNDAQRNRILGVGKGRRLTPEQKELIEELLSASPRQNDTAIARIVGTMPGTIGVYRKRKSLRDNE